MSINNLRLLLSDKYFWLVHIAAILFWLVLMWINSGPNFIGAVVDTVVGTTAGSLSENLRLSWVLYQPLLFLQIAFVYPILEELVFRGLLQGRIAKYPMGHGRLGFISVANIITSLLFVLFHLTSHSIHWAVAVFIPSIIFGYFRDKYRSVIPAIILHINFNVGYFLLFPPWVFLDLGWK